jgi:hypothetical protein
MSNGVPHARNRQVIGAREARVAVRFRAVEQAYRKATDRDVVFKLPQPTSARRSPQHVVDREIEPG